MQDVIVALFTAPGLDRAAQGALGAARRLSDALSTRLHAVLIGEANELMTGTAAQIADEVTLADDPALASYQPEVALAALAIVLVMINVGIFVVVLKMPIPLWPSVF